MIAKALRAIGMDVVVAVAFEGPFIEVYENNGFEVHVIRHQNWLRSDRLFKFVRNAGTELLASERFCELYKAVQAEFVYVNSTVSLASAVAARRKGLPLIWHMRELFSNLGGEMKCPRIFGHGFVSSVIKNLSKMTVSGSRVVAENMLLNAETTEVIHNAVAEDFFKNIVPSEKFQKDHDLPPDKFVLGIPGTMRPAKGHFFLMDALPEILDHIPECYVLVTGRDNGFQSYENELQDLINRLNIESHVRLLGNVKDMRAFYDCCDLICVPSRSESFGRTVIEAFASQKAVIATRVGGIPEIVKDEENGLLVNYGDTEQMASGIVRLYNDEQLRQKLIENGWRDAMNLYHEEIYKERIGNLVEKVLSEGKDLVTQ